jgi:hypothetical protein
MARHSPKGQKSKRSKKSPSGVEDIPTIDIDAALLSDDIPDAIKIAVADAMIAYGAMENTAERLIWTITGLSYDDGRLMTRLADKFEILKTLTENYGLIIHPSRQTTTDMWTAIRQLVQARNLMIHGVWAMLDHRIPVSISSRLPTTTGNVVGEAFPQERLEAITRQSFRVKESLDRLLARVKTSPPIRPARYAPG